MDNFQTLLNSAYFYLKFRLRTKKEIRIYLLKKSSKFKIDEKTVDQVIKHLEEIGLIDDKKFISAFVEQRKILKPKGEFVLRGELLKLGIEKDMLDEYFSNNSLNEEELAYKVLESRWNSYKNLDKRKKFQKACQFLIRRGFNFDTAKKLISRLLERHS